MTTDTNHKPAFKKSYNWDQLKAEFMQWEGSIEGFRKHKGIGNTNNFYKKFHEFKFKEARQSLINKSLAKIEKSKVAEYADKWKRQMILWSNVESVAAKIISKRHENLAPDELSSLSTSIEKALKCQKLILGEMTDRSENANINVHVALTDLIEKNGDTNQRPLFKQIVEDAKPLQD